MERQMNSKKREMTETDAKAMQLLNQLPKQKAQVKLKSTARLFPRELFRNCKYRFSLAQPVKAWTNPKKNKKARRARPKVKAGNRVNKWVSSNKYAR